MIDTLRRDAIGVYGADTPTPHLDALAARGVAHRGLLASFHQTSMSMAALFTGRTPSLESGRGREALGWTGRTWCGLARFASRDDARPCIPDSVETLGEALGRAGYWTAAVTTNPLLFRPAGFDRGFDEWVELAPPPPRKTPDGRTRIRRGGVPATAVNETVAAVLDTRPDAPLFLYVHYMDVHDYMLRGRPYADMVARTDRAIGELLEALEARDLLADAAIFLVADHGETLDDRHWKNAGPGHRGNPSFDEQLAVPLIVSPARYAPERPWLRGQDLFAWLARVAGAAPAPDAADAGDAGDAALAPDELFVSELGWQTYQRGRFKSHRRRAGGRLRLVDLETDPGERRDVAGEHPEVVAEHAARMDVLTRALAAPGAASGTLSEADADRLRQLGYLE